MGQRTVDPVLVTEMSQCGRSLVHVFVKMVTRVKLDGLDMKQRRSIRLENGRSLIPY